ncbi:MAG: helix-turn-helix transcriptional regulator [Alphaproteobacteria bacterium]|nr:helix-turn-helix transcriptional regulator [Alphaproteobacteria bacterium]MBV9694953.1 helix-turn-helix transcriptional regulator [Alphaproteobacteria bacterium]
MPKTSRRNAIDEHVGARLRARRKSLGMSQSVLAERLGVTFQMVQRYEYGLCRISASTLYAAALALEAPVSFFFDGLSQPKSGRLGALAVESSPLELARTRHGRDIALLFPRIQQRAARRAIVELVRAMVMEARI